MSEKDLRGGVQIVLTRNVLINGQHVDQGQSVIVSPDQARGLIVSGKAVRKEIKPTKKAVSKKVAKREKSTKVS